MTFSKLTGIRVASRLVALGLSLFLPLVAWAESMNTSVAGGSGLWFHLAAVALILALVGLLPAWLVLMVRERDRKLLELGRRLEKSISERQIPEQRNTVAETVGFSLLGSDTSKRSTSGV